jgi:hypothetical protein
LNPVINPSDFYFITETVTPDPTDGATQAEWGFQVNNLTPLQTGFYSEFAGGAWFAVTGDGATTPVFSVSGDSVPEPRSSAALLAAGLAGMLVLRRSRNASA